MLRPPSNTSARPGRRRKASSSKSEVCATLQLWESEITQLTRELVQEAVSFEELQSAGEEKDTSILELQHAAETARADLEKEKKQVEGKSHPEPFVYRSVCFAEICFRHISFSLPGSVEEERFEDIGEIKPEEPQVPKVDLKPLPKGLKYEFVGPDKTYPVIVSDELSPEENEKLLILLKNIGR
jgi:hypothetical protein